MTAATAEDVLNPAQRTIMKLKQLYMEDKAGDLCEENPVMSTECDACTDMGLGARETCCSGMMQFSSCHDQLVPILREWEVVENQVQIPAETEGLDSMSKRYLAARWGLTKAESPVQWGKQIKRYGMASGRRFNFNKFKGGNYVENQRK